MSDTGAFQGDPAIKAELLARLDAHIAAGTLVFGREPWDGTKGSPLGVSIEGDDPAVYAERFGFPLSLAYVTDAFCSYYKEPAEAIAFAREWVAAVEPGSRLDGVPRQLVLHELAKIDQPANAAALRDEIAALHRLEQNGGVVPRGDWSALRDRIATARTEAVGRVEETIFDILEAACWPAGRGRSAVNTLLATVLKRGGAKLIDGWSHEKEQRAQLVLKELWAEQAEVRERGEVSDYMTLLKERDPLLGQGFQKNQSYTYNKILSAGVDMAQTCLQFMREAPRA